MGKDPSTDVSCSRDELLAKTLLLLEDWKLAGLHWIFHSSLKPSGLSHDIPGAASSSSASALNEGVLESLPVQDPLSLFHVGQCQRGLAFIRLCPSLEECQKNSAYSDAAGGLLQNIIKAMKLSPDDVYCTYLFKEDPGMLSDKDPRIFAALEALAEQLEQRQARVVVSFSERLSQWMSGQEAPYDILRNENLLFAEKFILVPALDPGLLIRRPELKRPVWQDMQKVLQQLQDSLADQ